MSSENFDPRKVTFILEKGDGVEELVWEKSLLKYISTDRSGSTTLDFLRGISGSLQDRVVALEIGDKLSMLDTLRLGNVTGGRLYLCQSDDVSFNQKQLIGRVVLQIKFQNQ